MDEKLSSHSLSMALLASIKVNALEKLLINDSNRNEYNALLKSAIDHQFNELLKSTGVESSALIDQVRISLLAQLSAE